MTKVLELLKEYEDPDNAKFIAKLVPNLSPDCFLGVRLPNLRRLAKEFIKDRDAAFLFMRELPHEYHDENVFHSLLITYIKDYDVYLEEIERFLPYIDNWAVCDMYSPKAVKKHEADLIKHVQCWMASSHSYTCRYGMGMLMGNYLDEYFKPEYLDFPSTVRSDEYYVNMMTAWLFATALAKQWEAAIPYIENEKLDRWTHNKAIQKSCESFRVTEKHKDYLRNLRRK